MAFSELEQRVLAAIDAREDEIIAFARDIFEHPEMGYKEVRTAQAVCDAFDRLGLSYEKELAVTGVKAWAGENPGPRVCIIGEMDCVSCTAHPEADRETGNVHACGHHAQMGAMMGAAMGLVESGVLPELAGKVCFFAVPAEEYIDLDYRRGLRNEGKISHFGGKQELIRLGAFDDVDMAMMVHAQGNTPEGAAFVHGGSLGFVEKQITFRGRAAHASTPSEGVNALNAAALAILGMHANRERFREEDKIRVHPIITKGGDIVNSVPDEVCMDSYVRGVNFDAILSASADTDRAAKGAAAMVGAEAQIKTSTGYFPQRPSFELGEVFRQVAGEFLPADRICTGIDMVGSTDIGDLSHLIPCIQPTMGGFDGGLHSKEFVVTDPRQAYILPAKIMALTVVRLLADGGKTAQAVMDTFEPPLTKEAYLDRLNQNQ